MTWISGDNMSVWTTEQIAKYGMPDVASADGQHLARLLDHWRRTPEINAESFRAGWHARKQAEYEIALGRGIFLHNEAIQELRKMDKTQPATFVSAKATSDAHLFNVVRLMVRDVLHRPFDHPWREWSVQRFGMIRCYFGEQKRYRLNLWTSKLAVPGVSIIHDHPWDFTSWVIGGQFTNVRYAVATIDYGRYRVSSGPATHHCQTIKTGEGGGPVGEVSDVYLHPMQPELYWEGDTYKQIAEEVHASYYEEGTVTLNDRTKRGDGEHARVFWPIGQTWVDAQPRIATEDEVWRATRIALREWFWQ